jgi:hypothetical protein
MSRTGHGCGSQCTGKGLIHTASIQGASALSKLVIFPTNFLVSRACNHKLTQPYSLISRAVNGGVGDPICVSSTARCLSVHLCAAGGLRHLHRDNLQVEKEHVMTGMAALVSVPHASNQSAVSHTLTAPSTSSNASAPKSW